jgi:hypothetical protein
MLSAMDERPADDFDQVRLILARQRQLGASFEEAWAMVFEALPAQTAPRPLARVANREREGVLAALATTREDLRRAYLRLSPPEPPKSARVVARRPARAVRRRRLIITE